MTWDKNFYGSQLNIIYCFNASDFLKMTEFMQMLLHIVCVVYSVNYFLIWILDVHIAKYIQVFQ
jgi:hypothetical protein